LALSDVEIAQVVEELAPVLSGATVGKIYQSGETLALELGRERLILSAQPRASRLHLERTRFPAPTPPPAFAMLLRKRLSGHRLHALRLLTDGERVVALEFGPGRDRLVAELTGAHANVFLLDPEDKIAGILRTSGSTSRVLSPGHPYTLPSAAPATARFRGRKRFGDSPGVAARVAAFYDAELLRAEEEALRARAGVAIRRTVERLNRLEAALVGDLERVAAAQQHRKLADLILAHVHGLPSGRGHESVTVEDVFEDGAPLTIPLDPALDIRANAARLYKQHKRLTAGRKHVDARLAAARAEREAVLARLARLEHLTLEELRDVAPGPAPKPSRRQELPERLPYKTFSSTSGDVIWVGRSASDNDTLTFRHARGGDLWLHCRDVPGSHVIVPLRSRTQVGEATFVDAAMLAAYHSPLRDEAQVDVMYTHVKNLRKPKGGKPGLVFASDGKTIRVRLDPERLGKLLRPIADEAG
jgi:predicted ribosome quality control (RQC) complex YloA/Tae2 family protein